MIERLFRKKNIQKAIEDLNDKEKGEGGLQKILTVRDLTFFGIAAIIGAGIFSTIGRASFNGGPAVTLLFIFTAIACVFTALSYAQFASTIPVSGSAYTYAYVSFGELFAWIIGWALILEYAVSNMVVAISWSEYFVSMLQNIFHVHFPRWLAIDSGTAKEAFEAFVTATKNNTLSSLTPTQISLADAFQNAPVFAGFKVIINLPAALITGLITALIYVGIKESRNASNILVLIKLGVILLVIVGGLFYVKTENWTPFAPNGMKGVMLSVASVFFAFIGFDSISTTAEECKNPQRDLPKAMMYCLAICTVLYVIITLVLTGMVNYKELGVNDPLAYVFEKVNLDWMAGVISVSAVVAITSALLAYQVGQPRIWMSMSRDGLLPKLFSDIHPKYKTPWFATIITGLFVGIPSLFLNMQFFIDLTSVGTLFAFILVCAGILYMDSSGLSAQAKFKVPYINSKFVTGILLLVALYFVNKLEGGFMGFMSTKPLLWVFWLVWLGLAIFSFIKNFSLFPILGILTNLYLMTELGLSNWNIFLIWLAIGLVFYFAFGYSNSKLSNKNNGRI
jgi:basic amino acid/polyamine antiporter, APA family